MINYNFYLQRMGHSPTIPLQWVPWEQSSLRVSVISTDGWQRNSLAVLVMCEQAQMKPAMVWMFVSPRNSFWNFNALCDRIRRWGYLGGSWVMSIELSWTGLVPCNKRGSIEIPSPSHHARTQRGGVSYEPEREPSPSATTLVPWSWTC